MALSAPRDVPRRGTEPLQRLFDHPVKTGVKVWAGGIAVVDATGYAIPGKTATGLVALGYFESSVDNTAGASGDVLARVVPGTRKLKNSSSADEIKQSEFGRTCFIVDDETVAKTDGSSTRSAAGKVVGIDADGVWVQIALY